MPQHGMGRARGSQHQHTELHGTSLGAGSGTSHAAPSRARRVGPGIHRVQPRNRAPSGTCHKSTKDLQQVGLVAASQAERAYATDRAVATESHRAYGTRTMPAQVSEQPTTTTSTQVSTAAAAKQVAAAPSR